MRHTTDASKEKKNRRRGILFAFFFHAGLIIFGLIPFLTAEKKVPEYEQIIEIQFAQFESSSTKAEKKAGAKKKAEVEKVVEKKKVKKVEEKPTPKPKPRKPIVTSKDKKAPSVKTSKTPPKKNVPKPDPRNNPVEKSDKTAKETSSESAGESKKEGKGKGSHGTGKDKGKAGEGKSGDDFTGTAIFDRKVIYRPDIKKIVKKKGRIAINLCINREGRVILVKYDKKKSTITDTDNIRKTLEATKLYRFETDYTVPKEQCGKITFIIDK